VLATSGGGFGHAVPADAIGQADSIHLDREPLADPTLCRLRVARPVEHRLHCHPDALLGENLVEQLLRHAQILGRAPTAPI